MFPARSVERVELSRYLLGEAFGVWCWFCRGWPHRLWLTTSTGIRERVITTTMGSLRSYSREISKSGLERQQ